MRYDRKIRYLAYLENGARVRNGGFLKLEVREESFQMELAVMGARCAKEYLADVILCGNGRQETLGKIQLEDGRGKMRHACQINSGIGDTEIEYGQLDGIRIPLGEGREIAGSWEAAGMPRNVTETSEVMTEPRADQAPRRAERREAPRTAQMEAPGPEQADQTPERAERREAPRTAQMEAPGSEPADQEPRRTGRWEPPAAWMEEPTSGQADQESKRMERREPPQQSPRAEEVPGRRAEVVPLLESKWMQLCAIYPHIKPFQDQREYLSIGPEDFVLLSSESYQAAGNSFMLHGYYHYKHLILAREESRGEYVYYVGVPGKYHDREKQVALMFGFGSFECAQEPAQSEDYGYYMMRVQL